MSIHDDLIEHSGFDWPSLLSEWNWLVPSRFTVLLMNRFGDLFLVFEDGSVHKLDVSGGTLERLANDREEFYAKLDAGDTANDWFLIPLVDRLAGAGINLDKGTCYGFKLLPILGGDYSTANFRVLPIAEHFGFCGSIHNQIKDLPDGAQVVIEWTKECPRRERRSSESGP